MSFPLSPTNGQQATLNGIVYSYSTSTSAWTRINGSTLTYTAINLTSTTASTGTNTGALIVAGGAGIAGNLYVGNTIYSNGYAISTGTISSNNIPVMLNPSTSTFYQGIATTFTITNYDYFTTYSTTSTTGSASVSGNTITYTPSATGTNNLTVIGGINSRTVTFTVGQTSIVASYIVVAGGGGGGASYNAALRAGGGGGAGGFRSSVPGSPSGGGASAESQITLVRGTTYSITVGSGSSGGQGASGSSGFSAVRGNNSSIIGGSVSITSTGGGGGIGTGGTVCSSLYNGGSGGGSYYSNVSPGTGTSGQGFNGGGGSGDLTVGGGGGGAGSAGVYGSGPGTNAGGQGGAGVQSSITGSALYYAGGGGGSANCSVKSGGSSVGGNGNYYGTTAATNGAAYTGSGGGGAGAYTGSNLSGNGATGVVILSYPTYIGAPASTTGTPTVITTGSNYVYKWTGNGSITF